MKKFPFYKQLDQMDCGPSCLRMVAKHYGRNFSLQKLREISGINRLGVSLLGISEAAEKIGFRTTGLRISHDKLLEIELPCIIHWHQNHFVVLYKAPKAGGSPLLRGRLSGEATYHIADPAKGLIKYNEQEFLSNWLSTQNNGHSEGIVLNLSPVPDFYNLEGDKEKALDFSYVFSYLFKYKQLILQLLAGLAVGSLLQLILPFLAQALVDIGINTRNLNFIYIILIAQTTLFLGRMSVDFIRSWILLHISTRDFAFNI